jgi:CubicO group peptidase (beta-lactamase class C family)
LNHGRLGGKQILQPESHALLWRPSMEIGEPPWEEAIGLSWFLGTYHGHPVVNHSGSDPGFGTDFVIIPDLEATVIMLTNSNITPMSAILKATLAVLLGLEVEPPKPPITAAIGPTLATEGVEAAIEHYRLLQATQPDDYDFNPSWFLDASWSAIEAYQAHAVQPLLALWLSLHPDSSEVYWMLGWAAHTNGDNKQAVEHLRRALALDPESHYAAHLLQKLTA